MLYGSVSAPTLDGVSVGAGGADGGYTQWGELQDSTSGGCGTGLSYMATIGIMVHELGHDLWLPDEYDVDQSSEGVGKWGIMGGGSWNYVTRSGDSPAHPGAWDKWYEGWLTPTQITSSSTVSIAQVETSATVYQLLDNPGGVDWSYQNSSGTGEYFLVENRQQTGYDVGLPDCGILIWHIDETVTSSILANIDEWGRRLVALEQADGLFDLENNTNRGDAGDPYTSEGRFGGTTTPDSNLYDGSASGVSVEVNDNCGTNMSVTLGVDTGEDTDGDSVPDNQDNCPTIPNGPDGGTCSVGTIGEPCTIHGDCGCEGECSIDQEDVDEDGYGDVCDNCLNNCNYDQWDADVDGIGDVCDPTPGCGKCAQPECETECYIEETGVRGTVYYSTTPLSDIRVSLWQNDGPSFAEIPGTTVYTDNNGNYEILYDVPGEYCIYPFYSQDYCQTLWCGHTINEGEMTTADLHAEKDLPLINPPNLAVLTDTTPTFEWDANPEAVSYDLYIGNFQTQEMVLNQTGITETSYTLSEPLSSDNTYYWMVSGSDLAWNGVARACEGYRFTIE